MHQRCTSPLAINYDRYGGRGITVCERWSDFWAFVEDMGPRPEGKTPGGRGLYSLDRIDGALGYSPENCRWATLSEQNSNRRTWLKTHCPHGHEYTEENAWVDKQGKRRCRQCARDRRARLKAED